MGLEEEIEPPVVSFSEFEITWRAWERASKIDEILEEAEADPNVGEDDFSRLQRIASAGKHGRRIPFKEIPAGYKSDRKWEPAKTIDDYIEQIVSVVEIDDPIDLLKALRESDQNYAVKDWSVMGPAGPDFWLGQIPIRWTPCRFLKQIGYVDIDVAPPRKSEPERRRLILTRAGKDGKFDEHLDL